MGAHPIGLNSSPYRNPKHRKVPPTIPSFGLITVTHSRNGDFSVIEKYLQRYTETECYRDFISEINLIWNNEEAP